MSYKYPLFVFGDSPFTLYIVKDSLIALERTGQVSRNNWLALTHLHKLAQHSKARSVIPSNIIDILSKMKTKIHSQPCICGFFYPESSFNWCLAYRLAFTTNEKPAIHLTDFALLESGRSNDIYVTELADYAVYLPIQDFFILLGNIHFEGNHGGRFLTERYKNETFHEETIRLQFEKRLKDNGMSENLLMDLLQFTYFKYLLQGLEDRTLTPEYIFRLSGSEIIVDLARFNEQVRSFIREKVSLLADPYAILSPMDRICYSILALNLGHLNHLEEFNQLYTSTKKLATRFLTENITKFPGYRDGVKLNRDELFDFYLEKKYSDFYPGFKKQLQLNRMYNE